MKSQIEKPRGHTAGEVPESPGSVCLELGREICLGHQAPGRWLEPPQWVTLHRESEERETRTPQNRRLGRAGEITNALYLYLICSKLVDFQLAGDMAPVSLWPSRGMVWKE